MGVSARADRVRALRSLRDTRRRTDVGRNSSPMPGSSGGLGDAPGDHQLSTRGLSWHARGDVAGTFENRSIMQPAARRTEKPRIVFPPFEKPVPQRRMHCDCAQVMQARWVHYRGMDVEVRYVQDCPNLSTTRERLRKALDAVGRDDVEVRLRLVGSAQDAIELGFVGSPTVVVDGSDPLAAPDAAVGMSCRLYRTATGLSGAPTVEQLTAALTRGSP